MTRAPKSIPKSKVKVASTPARKTTLIAVTGLSPAILTETVWALAKEHQILPDRVVLITTTQGKKNLKVELFTPQSEWSGMSVWEALRTEMGAPSEKLRIDGYRVMTSQATMNSPAPELEDICDDRDNAAAADYILNQVRTEVQSSDLLIASIAGGRKTMGTLLYAAMSLVARPEDWVTHVIVNDPFDKRLHPRFYFKPEKAIVHELRHEGKTVPYSSQEAVIRLAKIPFVPLGNRFKDLAEHEQPSTFLETVSRIARQEINDTPYVASVSFDHDHKSLILDGNDNVEMENATHLNVFEWLCRVQDESWLPKQKKSGIFQSAVEFCKAWHGMGSEEGQVHKDWRDNLKKVAARHKGAVPSWVENLEARDFTKALARIRECVPSNHPWKQLPEKTLALPPLKLVSKK